jgi:hypothetical protein
MEEQTCGQGLAENSVLPAQLAEVTEAMADNLQVHMQALELDDPAARQEHAVYLRLVEEQRQAAGPPARRRRGDGRRPRPAHGPPRRPDMTSPEVTHAFQHLVRAKQELLALLQRTADQDRRMLAAMEGPRKSRAVDFASPWPQSRPAPSRQETVHVQAVISPEASAPACAR